MNIQEIFGRFPRLFWLVNTIELFERGAYYGMLAVLPYHLVYNLHFPTTSFGVLLGILTPFLYLLPIISGALVEKYGFRPMLVFALVLVVSGYLASAFMTTFEAFVLAFVVFGTGVGTFKPIISASIAHTTRPESRNLGYSIYYWMINLGSFSMPLLISFAIPKQDYVYVFYLSAALISINIALAIFMFRDPVPSNPGKSVADVFKGAALVVKDIRFMALLLIYSGFWFMYATNHLALLLYALDFGVLGDWFPPALVAVVNPGTIILLGPFLGKLFSKQDSLKVMVLGMGIFIAGLLVLGLSTAASMFFVGIVIFSIGEFVTHPTYIAYVSKIAPRDRLTVYMAYAFIPPLIGLTAGNVVGGAMYSFFAEELNRPKLFWGAITAVGLLTIALLLLYGQTMGRKRQDEDVAPTDRAQPYPAPPGALDGIGRPDPAGTLRPVDGHPVWESRLPVLVTLLLVPGLLLGAFAGGTDRYFRSTEGEGTGSWEGYRLVQGRIDGIGGQTQENSETVEQVVLEDANLVNVTFTLRWTDESDMQRILRTYENQPDQFGLEVEPPGQLPVASKMVANVQGKEGRVDLALAFEPARPGTRERTGTYNVTVICGPCGDFTNRASVLPYADSGNTWTLEVDYQYYKKK